MSRSNRVPTVADVNGIKLAYQVFGTGSPLVLLHGGFGSVQMFGPNVELLAAGRRVIGVDLQSHGRSPAPRSADAFRDDGRRHCGPKVQRNIRELEGALTRVQAGALTI